MIYQWVTSSSKIGICIGPHANSQQHVLSKTKVEIPRDVSVSCIMLVCACQWSVWWITLVFHQKPKTLYYPVLYNKHKHHCHIQTQDEMKLQYLSFTVYIIFWLYAICVSLFINIHDLLLLISIFYSPLTTRWVSS